MKKILFLILLLFMISCTTSTTSDTSSNSNDSVTKESGDVMYVDSKLMDCVGVGPQKCMLVKENKNDEWQYFYSKIEGFDYEEGYSYKLLVKKTKVDNVPADASSIKYKLVEILEKK